MKLTLHEVPKGYSKEAEYRSVKLGEPVLIDNDNGDGVIIANQGLVDSGLWCIVLTKLPPRKRTQIIVTEVDSFEEATNVEDAPGFAYYLSEHGEIAVQHEDSYSPGEKWLRREVREIEE